MQYIGFVLGAMAADYFPRLTGVIHDHKAATRLVNEQTEIALLLSAPVFIAIVGLTPWVIQLLYTDAFLPAVEVLRWQILGDVLKVASWPLGFVLVAAGAGKTFFVTETIAVLILGGLIAGFTSSVGIKITGIAFFVSYAVLLPLLFWLARRRIGFVWTGSVVKLISVIFVVCAGVAIICTLYWWGAFVAVVLALAFGVYTLGRLANISNVAGRVGKINFLTQKWSKLIGIKK
jgi:PST family polysaccharide transporter